MDSLGLGSHEEQMVTNPKVAHFPRSHTIRTKLTAVWMRQCRCLMSFKGRFSIRDALVSHPKFMLRWDRDHVSQDSLTLVIQ
jgi:hypothetical protein